MKEQILRNLIQGRWSFRDLLPLYTLALDERCRQRRINLEIPVSAKSLAAFTSRCTKYDLREHQIIEIPQEIATFLQQNDIPGQPISLSTYEVQLRTEALDLIQYSAPESFLTWRAMDGVIRISGGDFYGASHPHLMTMILLGDKFFQVNKLDRALSLVHEMAHQELFLINTLDRLVEYGSEYNMIHAPFQGKERPPIARLHSLFALFRMVQLERQNNILLSNNLDLLVANIKSFRNGELTPYGMKVVEHIHSWTAQ